MGTRNGKSRPPRPFELMKTLGRNLANKSWSNSSKGTKLKGVSSADTER